MEFATIAIPVVTGIVSGAFAFFGAIWGNKVEIAVLKEQAKTLFANDDRHDRRLTELEKAHKNNG